MQLIERLIIARLIEELDAAGFVPVKFWDGEEYQTVEWRNDSTQPDLIAKRVAAATECVASVDEGTLHFAPKSDLKSWGRLGVLLILGNGQDVISDHHVASHAPAFAKAIDKVCDWINERTPRATDSNQCSDGQLDSRTGHGGKPLERSGR